MKFFVSWFLIGVTALSVLVFGTEANTGEEIPEEASAATYFAVPELSHKAEIAESGDKTSDASDTEEKITVTVWIAEEKAYAEMSESEYLYGVLLGETLSDFGDEALKAQAVAARTFIYYKAKRGNPSEHKYSPVCTSSAHCMAYLSPEEYMERAGEGGADFLERVKNAVDSTAGEIMTCSGEPIMAVFFSCAYGKTRSSADKWNADYPYLQSVSTPETAETVKKLVTEKSVKLTEFYDRITEKYSDAAISAALIKNGMKTEKNQSGRVKSVIIGETEISGGDMKSMFGLRSEDFDISVSGDTVTFTVRGNGHGVGMSQYGAKIYADNGKNYLWILSHYYSGVTVEKCF